MINMEERAAPERKKSDIRSAISGIMLSVVLAILVVVVMAYLTRITFQAEIDWAEQGANAALLVVCSVAVTIIMRQWGRLKGENVPEHGAMAQKISGNIEAIISGHNSGRAAEYCRAWEREEYRKTIERILVPYNVSYDEFKNYRIFDVRELFERYGDILSKAQINAVLTAKKVKVLHYSEDFLLTDFTRKTGRSSPSGGLTVNQRNTLMTVQNIVTAVLMSLVMVSFAVEVIIDPSLATVVSCLLKVLTLIFSGIWAAFGGYNLSAKIEVERMRRQEIEQRRFISWCEENATPALPALGADEKTEQGS